MTKTVKVRRLKKVHFDKDGSHLSYTTPEYGGAASLKNEAYLFKALEVEDESSPQKESQALACDKSLDKREKTENPQKEKPMTDNVNEKVEALQRELNVQKTLNKVVKYPFDEEAQNDLSEAMADLNKEQQTSIFKAFDSLISAKVEVEKQLEKSKGAQDNPLTKALDEEAGESGSPDAPVEKTLVQEVEVAAKAIRGEK